MSNPGFSLDRNFSASEATRRRSRGLPPVAAPAREKTAGRWTPAAIVCLSLGAALFGALAAKFLF